MKGKFFLDTNIFVYHFDLNAPEKFTRAVSLVEEGINTERGVISYQVVQEFFNVALTRFPRPMSASAAEHYFSTTFRRLTTVQASPLLFLEAIQIRDAYRLSWYDALIVAAAVQAQCETLYTEDLQHGFRLGGLRVQNPFGA